jgi:hypothetical protein
MEMKNALAVAFLIRSCAITLWTWAFLGFARDPCLCRIGHKHVYLADPIMPHTMSKPTGDRGR